jgi:hypothetical protein
MAGENAVPLRERVAMRIRDTPGLLIGAEDVVHALQTEEMSLEACRPNYPCFGNIYHNRSGRWVAIVISPDLLCSQQAPVDPFPLMNLGSLTETSLTHREKSVLRFTSLRLSLTVRSFVIGIGYVPTWAS